MQLSSAVCVCVKLVIPSYFVPVAILRFNAHPLSTMTGIRDSLSEILSAMAARALEAQCSAQRSVSRGGGTAQGGNAMPSSLIGEGQDESSGWLSNEEKKQCPIAIVFGARSWSSQVATVKTCHQQFTVCPGQPHCTRRKELPMGNVPSFFFVHGCCPRCSDFPAPSAKTTHGLECICHEKKLAPGNFSASNLPPPKGP